MNARRFGAPDEIRRPAALEQRADLTPELVKFFVRKGVSIMPPFWKTEITDAELDALADYLSHAPGAKCSSRDAPVEPRLRLSSPMPLRASANHGSA